MGSPTLFSKDTQDGCGVPRGGGHLRPREQGLPAENSKAWPELAWAELPSLPSASPQLPSLAAAAR